MHEFLGAKCTLRINRSRAAIWQGIVGQKVGPIQSFLQMCYKEKKHKLIKYAKSTYTAKNQPCMRQATDYKAN